MNEFETRLRVALGDLAGDVSPADDLITTVVRTHRIERRRRRVVCSAALVAGAAVVAVPVSLCGSHAIAPQAIVVKAHHASFRYPANFHAADERGNNSCAEVTFVQVDGHGDHQRIPGASTDDLRFVQRAISSSGACISVAFSYPYSVAGGGTDPTIPQGATAVQIGSLNGFDQTVAEPSGPQTYLYVQLPERGDSQRDLVFSSTGLSVSQLINVVAGGLSS